MKNYRRSELMRDILTGLAAGGFIVTAFALPGLPQLCKLFQTKDARDRYRLKRTLEALDKLELVRTKNLNGREVVEITSRGQKRVLDYDFDDLVIKQTKKWDGKWRLVIFDIPNNLSKKRRLVSNKLKELGLYQFQKSIYIYPYDCEGIADFIRGFLSLSTDIKYLVASKIPEEDNRQLQRHFKI